jgi:hypothetical protein
MIQSSAVQQNSEQMRLALRVLNALNEKKNPEPEDVAKLRCLAPEISAQIDELACEIIARNIAQRVPIRRALAGCNCPTRDRLAEDLRVAKHEAEWIIREEFRIIAGLSPTRATGFHRVVRDAEEQERGAALEYLRHVCSHGCTEQRRAGGA